MNANNTTTTLVNAKAARRDEMIALAHEIRGEFAKLHALMAKTLAGATLKKAAYSQVLD